MIQKMKDEMQFLYRVLDTIQAYLQDIILIGGFASLLYRFHEEATQIDSHYLITYDVDLAAEGKIPVRGDNSIHDLLEKAGLERKLEGNFEEPIVKYYPTEIKESKYYVEFLSPLSGSGTKRNGKPDLIETIQKDLSAQKLRYLDLLMKNTSKVHTSSISDLQEQPDLIVRIPDPSMYIMQKILILKERGPTDRNKEYAYIYQTLTCFRKHLKSLAGRYEVLITNQDWKRWYFNFLRLSHDLFRKPESDGSFEAAKILDDVTPKMVSAVVMNFIRNCPKI